MQYWKRILVMLLLGGSTATAAPPGLVLPSSLTPSSPVNNPGRQLLQQTQPQASSGRPPILAPSEENAGANPNEPKFFIHKIQVMGVTRLSPKALETILHPYEDRPLGVSDINVLMGKRLARDRSIIKRSRALIHASDPAVYLTIDLSPIRFPPAASTSGWWFFGPRSSRLGDPS